MQPIHFRNRSFGAAVLLVLLLITGGGTVWLCNYSDSLAFLPARSGAEWILDPNPPNIHVHLSKPISAIFKRSFFLDRLPSTATFTICAFQKATVFVNGQKINEVKCDGRNWKLPMTATIASSLHTGTNWIIVCVTNTIGPPALWSRLQADSFNLASDASWVVSLEGRPWDYAHDASKPIAFPNWSPLFDSRLPFDYLGHVWRELVFFLALALGLVICGFRWPLVESKFQRRINPVYVVFALVIIARIALFINDMFWLPAWIGFDAKGHEDYVKFIQENGTLPAASSGWETHQPPLYYLVCALVMKLMGFTAGHVDAVTALRAVNGVVGLVYCWVALLCFRRLFPENSCAQIVGLLLVAFLPPDLYLFMTVTNDPLAGLLVTTALYFLLRVFQSDTENIWFYAGIGLALGASMLTKMTALPALPAFLLLLTWRLIVLKKKSPGDWLGSLVIVLLLCLMICGWHYWRVWEESGAVALPNSRTSNWWQDPGYRTWSYYLHFGHVLIAPLFSGLHSFADGIYSTLWGDGLTSGTTELKFRPPWNYDMMNACYLFSMAITMLGIIGFVISTWQFRDEGKFECAVIPVLVASYLMAVFFLSLLAPWVAEVKAFYALPAFVPFCALVATGWTWFVKKIPGARNFLWLVVLVWSLSACSSFWIRSNNFETWRIRTFAMLDQKQFTQATSNITEALRLNPNDFWSRCMLAESLQGQGKKATAFHAYLAALEICPESPDALSKLATVFAFGTPEEAQLAAKLAGRACELTSYSQSDIIVTYVYSLANAGQNDKAISVATEARELALQNDDTNQVAEFEDLIEQLRK